MAILKVKDKNGNIIDIPAIRGYNAYQLALMYGFEGTEEEWLESLKGEKGDQGPVYELTDTDINRIIEALKAEIPMAEEQSV